MPSQFSYTRGEILLKVENVSLSFDDVSVLKDVSIEIKDIIRPDKTQGQIVALLAPSGMGKTQLFEIIAGLKPPTSGNVSIGTPLKPVIVGDIGVVAQNYPLFEQYTIEGNLTVAAKKMLIFLKNKFLLKLKKYYLCLILQNIEKNIQQFCLEVRNSELQLHNSCFALKAFYY